MASAAIYLRTSTEEHRDEFALVNDLETCRAHALSHGHTIVGEYNDVQPQLAAGFEAACGALAQRGGGVLIVSRGDIIDGDAADRLSGQQIEVEVAAPLAARAAA